MSVLDVRGVRKRFGDHDVLMGVDLVVDAHEAVVLIGASGSGKSTLLRTINLIEQVDDGQIFLSGDDITDPHANADAVRSRIGVVFQHFNLFPHMRVIDNVTLAARKVHGVDPARRRTVAAWSCWPHWGWARRRATTPTASPAASSSASRSCGRS